MSERERDFLERWVRENADGLRGPSDDPEALIETLLSQLIRDADSAGVLTPDLLAAAGGDAKDILRRVRNGA